jgi:hypothetical protein
MILGGRQEEETFSERNDRNGTARCRQESKTSGLLRSTPSIYMLATCCLQIKST